MRNALRGGAVQLVKPNLRELSQLVGCDTPSSDSEVIACARELLDLSADLRAVVVSLGERGALLVTDGEDEFVTAPEVEVDSLIGAGDSMVAGMVSRLVNGDSLSAATRYGVAVGTATVMTPGTDLCRRDDVERIAAEMGVG